MKALVTSLAVLHPPPAVADAAEQQHAARR